jgi:hypothetical protein
MFLSSNAGVGSGVEKSVMSALIMHLLKEGSVWKKIDETYVLSMELAMVPPTPQHFQHLCVSGFACLLFTIWLWAFPPDILPVFIRAMLLGDAAIVDFDFIQKFDAKKATALVPWPLQYNEMFDPYSADISTLICSYLEHQVRHFYFLIPTFTKCGLYTASRS